MTGLQLLLAGSWLLLAGSGLLLAGSEYIWLLLTGFKLLLAAAGGADLGGSSKYSREALEDRCGEGFRVNSR